MVTHQLQVRCRPVKVRLSETDVLPLSSTANLCVYVPIFREYTDNICEILCLFRRRRGIDELNEFSAKLSPAFHAMYYPHVHGHAAYWLVSEG